MRVLFNELKNLSSMNDKKENVRFLLSDKIISSSNRLFEHNFHILKNKHNCIYIDKEIITNIKNELQGVVDSYTKNNLHHLEKIDRAKNKTNKSISELSSLNEIKDFIKLMINETNSTSFKNEIFNVENKNINIFLDKNILLGIEIKSANKLIEKLKNKTIELNTGCDLPFNLNGNDMMVVKLGNLKAADYAVESNDRSRQNSMVNSYEDNKLERIKNIIMEFEIHFNFLNENIKQYHEIANNSCLFENIEEMNDLFDFIDGDIIKNIKKLHYKGGKLQMFNEKLVSSCNEINNNCKILDSYYQKNIFNIDDGIIINLDIDNLKLKLKEIKSNTDLLKLKLESLTELSSCISQCNNKFKNKTSYLEKNDKKIVCDSIIKVKEKTNESLSLLDGFIKRKATGFLSKVYKFFFPKKHNESLNILINYKSKINKISSYLDVYKEKNKYFTIGDICLMVTSKLSEINYPESLLGYLYGEKSKWDNFKQSLFKKDE